MISFDSLSRYVEKSVKDWTLEKMPQVQVPYRSGEHTGLFLVAMTEEGKRAYEERQQREQDKLTQQVTTENETPVTAWSLLELLLIAFIGLLMVAVVILIVRVLRLKKPEPIVTPKAKGIKQPLKATPEPIRPKVVKPKPIVTPKAKVVKRQLIEPEMKLIQGGCFLMGSPEDEVGRLTNEQQHEVSVDDFWLGQYAVTFAEWDACVAAGGCSYKPDNRGWEWGRSQRPVINVSWNDVQAYIRWLRDETGKDYRLPTEAEWEYAARAGTTTAFSFGDTITTQQANFDGNYSYNGSKKGRYLGKTARVGQYPANAFGLYDMHGNVWEWTCSAYEENYDGSESVCANDNDSRSRVLRGGSWFSRPLNVRSAIRGWLYRTNRSLHVGFRLARTR